MTTAFVKRSSIKGGGHTCVFASHDGVTTGTCRCPDGGEWNITADDADAVLAAWQAHRLTGRLKAEGERLRALRGVSGPGGGKLDVDTAAAALGVSRSLVHMWEQGERPCLTLAIVEQRYADMAALHAITETTGE